MLQFDLFVTVFYAAVRSASNSIRFCKKQLLSCLLAIYIGRGLEYFSINFNFFKFFLPHFIIMPKLFLPVLHGSHPDPCL